MTNDERSSKSEDRNRGSVNQELSSLRSGGGPLAAKAGGGDDWQDDVVVFFFKLQHELNALELIGDTKVDGSGGTEKIHGLGAPARPGIDILEVKASRFLLKKYSHTLHQCIALNCLAPARKLTWTLSAM